jgi:hypothetical protein
MYLYIQGYALARSALSRDFLRNTFPLAGTDSDNPIPVSRRHDELQRSC